MQRSRRTIAGDTRGRTAHHGNLSVAPTLLNYPINSIIAILQSSPTIGKVDGIYAFRSKSTPTILGNEYISQDVQEVEGRIV